MAADPRGRFVRGQVSDIHKIGGSLIHIAMKIPDVVLQEASETMEMLEGTLVYLGKIGDGREVYLLKQPIDAETGFPFDICTMVSMLWK